MLWNKHKLHEMATILDSELTFRGSLGEDKQGHPGFAKYVDHIHHALSNYTCTIEEMVTQGNKVFAKMLFSGIHHNEFMGYPPTNKEISWSGAALFTFTGHLISDIWVLGDLAGLKQQLEANAARNQE